MHRVLITGITGFLGSHIAEHLISNGVNVIGLKRSSSSIWRCLEIASQIEWVDIDEEGCWKSEIVRKKPNCIIHCAWMGVESEKRDDWNEQLKNVNFLSSLISIVEKINFTKFVFVGSQAEYGYIEGRIPETKMPIPLSAYGSVKLACYEILHTYCELNKINWLWLRVFSVFGEKENRNWLIPSMISRMLSELDMDFTLGEQKYAYLYVKDFASIIHQLLIKVIPSGVYNISSDKSKTLRSIVVQIRNEVNPRFKLNFGAIPYRSFQSMHLEGDISKLTKQIGKPGFTEFDVALRNTIDYYISK